MAAGLLRPTHGVALHRGSPIDRVNTSVGYLTQQDHLLPWRNVERNVGLALELQGVDRSERQARVTEALSMVGLQGFSRSYPSQLSGGMKKRAALARLLIYEPETLLLDEPFGALDAQLRMVMQAELLRIWDVRQMTVLFVTHDLEEAILVADEIVVFGTQPGRIIHTEVVDIARPRDLTVLRTDPKFQEIWSRLWDLIEGQLQVGAKELH